MEEMNLEAMHSQFATPKEQVAEQEIVNGRPIRETIMVKYKVISDVKITEYTSAMFAFRTAAGTASRITAASTCARRASTPRLRRI